MEELVDRLVGLHGEEGICPSAEDWRRILGFDADAPLSLLNLLAFAEEVSTPEGAISGSRAYARYTEAVAPAFARVGGCLLFSGAVGYAFPGDAGEAWHAAVLTRYPSPRALADFWLDPEFVAAHAFRVDGVDRSRVLVFGASDR